MVDEFYHLFDKPLTPCTAFDAVSPSRVRLGPLEESAPRSLHLVSNTMVKVRLQFKRDTDIGRLPFRMHDE